MPFALLQTTGLIIWLVLSKFSIVPWIRTKERHLTYGKLYWVRPMLPPPQQSLPRSRKGSAWEPDHAGETTRTIWQFAPILQADVAFHFSTSFFLKCLNSVVKVCNWQGNIWTESHFKTRSSLWNLRLTHSCIIHRALHQCNSTDFMLASSHLTATQASASKTPL